MNGNTTKEVREYMSLLDKIRVYEPFNEQEEHDKSEMLKYIQDSPGLFDMQRE